MLIAIDPGPTQSGWVRYEPGEPIGRVVLSGTDANEVVRNQLNNLHHICNELVIEQVASYGRPVGASVFETVYWSGVFAERFGFEQTTRRPFLDVKLELCHDSRAKESHVRQAVRDLFPKTGGGKRPEIGTKGQPGPLYGVTGHAWSALALAVAHSRLNNREA